MSPSCARCCGAYSCVMGLSRVWGSNLSGLARSVLSSAEQGPPVVVFSLLVVILAS